MKNKKIVFYGVMSMILMGAGIATAEAAPGNTSQIASKAYVDTLGTSVGTALNLKADKADTYSKTEMDTAFTSMVNKKDIGALAAKSTVGTIDIDDASVTKPKLSTDVQATLDKADTALQSADLTSYAQTADVNTALATKADQATTYTKTEVDTSLATKADQATTYNKTEVDTALGTKANTTDVNTALADKANTADVNTALATKADQATTYTKTEVDTSLGTKEDVVNKSTDITTDTGSTTKYTTVSAVENYVGGVLTNVNTDLSGKEDVANKSDNISADTGSTTKYTTVNAVETYSVPKPSANCMGPQSQCVLTIDKSSGSIYWEDVAMPAEAPQAE